MPTYEYVCKTCGEHLEVVQSFKDAALTECPACQGQLRKVFSAAGIIFKGSGWHVKDYAASGSSKDTSSSSDKASDKPAEASSSSSESKSSGSDTSSTDKSKSGSSSSSSSSKSSNASSSSSSGNAKSA